jgi:hypothetical protein
VAQSRGFKISRFDHDSKKLPSRLSIRSVWDTTTQIPQTMWQTAKNIPAQTMSIVSNCFEIIANLKNIQITQRSIDAKNALADTIASIPQQFANVGAALKNISDETEKDVGDNKVDIMFGDLIRIIPGITLIEHVYKVFIYQTINLALSIMIRSNKEQVAKDISKIMIESALAPHTMAYSLFEYILKYNLVISEESEAVKNLQSYLGIIQKLTSYAKYFRSKK